jgi:hypothetical protein
LQPYTSAAAVEPRRAVRSHTTLLIPAHRRNKTKKDAKKYRGEEGERKLKST